MPSEVHYVIRVVNQRANCTLVDYLGASGQGGRRDSQLGQCRGLNKKWLNVIERERCDKLADIACACCLTVLFEQIVYAVARENQLHGLVKGSGCERGIESRARQSTLIGCVRDDHCQCLFIWSAGCHSVRRRRR